MPIYGSFSPDALLAFEHAMSIATQVPHRYLFGVDTTTVTLTPSSEQIDARRAPRSWVGRKYTDVEQIVVPIDQLRAGDEIWWRPLGQTGVVPEAQRQLLGDGSLFLMPPGFQRTHQHRIPKCDRACDPRASLTYRRYVP